MNANKKKYLSLTMKKILFDSKLFTLNMKLIYFLLCLLVADVALAQQNSEKYLFVGTYTRGKSEGIYVYKFNCNSGKFKAVSVAKNIENPSFLSISPNEKYLYAVGEIDGEGAVSAFSFDKESGELHKLNTQTAGGANPCHISLDKTGKWAIVGNYTGGNLSILPIQSDGSLGKLLSTIQHTGKGTNTIRQEKPHVHSINIAPNNQDVFVADLGIDKLMKYDLNVETGELTTTTPPYTSLAAGSGPRHLVFHPNGQWVYVIQELSSTITAMNYQKGSLLPFQTVTTLPKLYAQPSKNFSADIHVSPDGKFVYGSNRFVDSVEGKNKFANDNFTDTIVIYAVNPKDGTLKYVGNEAVLGKVPRNFMITPNGKFMLVANQETDNITIFKRNSKTGKLKPLKTQIAVPTPVCLKMINF